MTIKLKYLNIHCNNNFHHFDEFALSLHCLVDTIRVKTAEGINYNLVSENTDSNLRIQIPTKFLFNY